MRRAVLPALDTFTSMDHIWWRFWWASDIYRYPGLYFWVGQRPGCGRMVRLWGVDFVLQVLIFVCTVPGLWYAGGNGSEAKWGFLILLIAQPLWLAATWRAGQFAMFSIAVIYAAIWARSVLNHF